MTRLNKGQNPLRADNRKLWAARIEVCIQAETREEAWREATKVAAKAFPNKAHVYSIGTEHFGGELEEAVNKEASNAKAQPSTD